MNADSFVYVLPAVSVTALAVAFAALQIPTCTISRLPVVITCPGTNVTVLAVRRAETCCTNTGLATAVGVTADDATDAGPAPTALTAVTVNV